MGYKGKISQAANFISFRGSHRDKIRPYATGLYFSKSKTLTEELCEEALGYVKDGFKSIKMKVGLNLKDDFKNVKEVRNAIGYDIELMIDANHAYSYDEALQLSLIHI